MIPSLPLITPRDAHTLWYTPSTTNTTTNPSFLEPSPTTLSNNTQTQQPHARRHAAANTTRSRLALVQQSTTLLSQRKQNIRRFGSNWIRPPGVPKTYQAMMDEAAEREEQAAEAAREQRLMEEQEAAEEIEMHMGGGEMADTDAGEGEERDLDEDVPEAGSYQHTDTEVEDESSEDEGEGFGSSGGVQRRVSAPRSEGSSILMGSSVLGSSPMGTRQSSGAFARRLGGREN